MNFNFENENLLSFGRESTVSHLSDVFEKQKKVQQPKEADFLNQEQYDKEVVEKEIAYVEKLKQQWQENNTEQQQKEKKISDVFEGIVINQCNREWLGGLAEAYYTAEADDYMRHTDCIIEFRPEEGKKDKDYLGLGIDVTFSNDYKNLYHKLDSSWEEVKRAKKTHLQYIETEEYKGKLDIHRVVLVCDKETVYDLADLYRKKEFDKLNTHPFLAVMIGQIKYQLESYYEYARTKRLPGKFMESLVKTLSLFYKIYDKHEAFYRLHDKNIQENESFKTIEDFCRDKIS